eukprot:scaffold13889_cov178-Amphora_coffeaeformis.AAC.1
MTGSSITILHLSTIDHTNQILGVGGRAKRSVMYYSQLVFMPQRGSLLLGTGVDLLFHHFPVFSTPSANHPFNYYS